MKSSFYLYQYIFVGPPLIKMPRLLTLDTCVGPRPTIRIPPSSPPLVCHCEEYIFQNGSVPCNYLVREKETKRQGLLYRGGRFWLFAGS